MTKEKEYVIGKIRKLKGRKFKALLGMGDSGSTVTVEGKADFVWIRLKYGSALAPPVEALNRHVPPVHGRLVTVQERDAAGQKGFEVIDWAGITYYHDTTTYEDLPAHGWTHESGPGAGSDPVNLYTRGWAELRVEPTVPCSMQAYVTYGWYLFDVPTWFNGGNSPVFVPPAIGSRMDLVYLDSSGTVGIEQGLFAIIPATPVVPEPPDYTIPLAAIELTGTTGCITDDMILDCRVMPNVKGPILFDDSLQPEAVEAGVTCWPGSASAPSRRDHRHQLVEPLELLDGTAGTPSYSFASEPTLGFWRRAAGEVGLNDDLWVGDHIRMATGTCTGDFNVGGDVTIAGTLTFIGAGGLVFGSCYGNHIGWSQATAVQNAWYNISHANMLDGQLHGVTHDGNGQLTVTEEGRYLITYSCCYEDTIANDHLEVGIEINNSGAAEAAGQTHSENKFANQWEHLGGGTILDLADNSTIEMAIRTIDAGTPTISVHGVNIAVTQVGGT